MEKVIAVFNLEGTIFKRSNYFMREIRDSQKRGIISVLKFAIFNLSLMMIFIGYKIGIVNELTIRTESIKWFATYLKGSSEKDIAPRAKVFASKYIDVLRPEISKVIQEHKAKGHITILISGMIQPYVEAIKQELGMDIAIGTEREVKDGYYTGRLASVPCLGERRAHVLSELVNKLDGKINLDESFAYGDAIFDRYYMDMVGNPVAVYPDKKLSEHSKEHGWKVIIDNTYIGE
jgi:HAD superfamily hydrolase (TIGR01490 family)